MILLMLSVQAKCTALRTHRAEQMAMDASPPGAALSCRQLTSTAEAKEETRAKRAARDAARDEEQRTSGYEANYTSYHKI